MKSCHVSGCHGFFGPEDSPSSEVVAKTHPSLVRGPDEQAAICWWAARRPHTANFRLPPPHALRFTKSCMALTSLFSKSLLLSENAEKDFKYSNVLRGGVRLWRLHEHLLSFNVKSEKEAHCKSWFAGRGWGQQLFSLQSPAVHWIARTSSLNCLSCRNPYQTPHSLNCLPPFHWKPLFLSLKIASSHPLPKNRLLHWHEQAPRTPTLRFFILACFPGQRRGEGTPHFHHIEEIGPSIQKCTSDPRSPHTRQKYEQKSGQNMTPDASKQGKLDSFGPIFLFIFLPCMWGLGFQNDSPSMRLRSQTMIRIDWAQFWSVELPQDLPPAPHVLTFTVLMCKRVLFIAVPVCQSRHCIRVVLL